MRKLAFSFAAFLLLATSCSKQPEKTIHEKLLSLYPQYVVRKAFETGNNLFIYSFDIKSMKAGLQQKNTTPVKASHELALVSAWEFPAQSNHKFENPLDLDGFSTCLYYDVQAFSPLLDFPQTMKKDGAIATESEYGSVYSLKAKDTKDKPVYTKSSTNSQAAIQTRSTKQTSQNTATLVVSGKDKPVTEFESVQICLQELNGYPAIAIAFLAESFAVKSEYKSIISPTKSPSQLIDMQNVFKRWGRNEFISNAAFGSKWTNGVETVKGVFVYQNRDKAQEDYETLQKDITQIPSFLTGETWYKRMNATVPQIGIKDSIVTIEFDMDTKDDSFQFPLLLRSIEKTGDWGWLWLK